MQKAIIQFDHQYVDGGCNACGVLRCETYSMKYLNKELGFAFMDIESLIQTITQSNQWKQDYQEVGIGEEVDGLTNGSTFVEVEKLGKKIRYENQANLRTMLVENEYPEKEELFAKINQILSQIFDIEPIAFEVIEIDK